MVVRAAMIYDFERRALIKRHKTKLKGPAGTGLAMSISEGQLRFSNLKTKLETQGRNGFEMCRAGIVDILGQ